MYWRNDRWIDSAYTWFHRGPLAHLPPNDRMDAMNLTKFIKQARERLHKAPTIEVGIVTHADGHVFAFSASGPVHSIAREPTSDERNHAYANAQRDREFFTSAPDTIDKCLRVIEVMATQLERDKDVIDFCYMGLEKPKEVTEIADAFLKCDRIVAGE